MKNILFSVLLDYRFSTGGWGGADGERANAPYYEKLTYKIKLTFTLERKPFHGKSASVSPNSAGLSRRPRTVSEDLLDWKRGGPGAELFALGSGPDGTPTGKHRPHSSPGRPGPCRRGGQGPLP